VNYAQRTLLNKHTVANSFTEVEVQSERCSEWHNRRWAL